MKIKKGDTVIIRTGKDRGKSGAVLNVFPKLDRVLVEGVNIVKKHQKAGRSRSAGQIIEKSLPVHISNVGIKDAKTGKASRVGYSTVGDKKVRISKQSGATL